MNRYDRDEQQLRAWLQGEAPGELPDWVLRHTFAVTRARSQQRGPRSWLASIRDRIASGNHRRSNMFTLATITTVAAAAILALSVVINDSQPYVTGAADTPIITVEEEPFSGFAVYGPPCLSEGGVAIDDCFQLDGVTFDDPRFQGSVRMLANSAFTDQGIYRNQFTITTEDGAWVGDSVPGLFLGLGESGAPSVHLFEGEGAYEGLYAVAAVQLNGGGFRFEGHVVHGGFPEIPEG